MKYFDLVSFKKYCPKMYKMANLKFNAYNSLVLEGENVPFKPWRDHQDCLSLFGAMSSANKNNMSFYAFTDKDGWEIGVSFGSGTSYTGIGKSSFYVEAMWSAMCDLIDDMEKDDAKHD